jgi:hypothetical protein
MAHGERKHIVNVSRNVCVEKNSWLLCTQDGREMKNNQD